MLLRAGTPHANWFLLDSLDKTNVAPGLLGESQLAWLAKALDARADKPALVLAHHNPNYSSSSRSARHEALFKLLLPRKQVKAYVFGHTHCWNVTRYEGVHFVNVPTTAWLFDPTQPRGIVTSQLRPNGATLVLDALDRSTQTRQEDRVDVAGVNGAIVAKPQAAAAATCPHGRPPQQTRPAGVALGPHRAF